MKDCDIDCSCRGGNVNCRKCGGKGFYTPDVRTPRQPRKVFSRNPVVVQTVSPSERAARQQKLLEKELALKKELELKKEQALKKELAQKELKLKRQLELKEKRELKKKRELEKKQKQWWGRALHRRKKLEGQAALNRAKDLLANQLIVAKFRASIPRTPK